MKLQKNDARKYIRLVLRGMEVGQSVILDGTEYVKTKQGFKHVGGSKVTQTYIIDTYCDLPNIEIEVY